MLCDGSLVRFKLNVIEESMMYEQEVVMFLEESLLKIWKPAPHDRLKY